jgi:Smr domain
MSLRGWWQRRAARPARGDTARVADDQTDSDDTDTDSDLFNPFPEPVRLEITDVFDLHTIAPRDVRRAVEAYLLEAHRLGFRSVRLIHGKGRGVQRTTVRAILARTPFVLDWTDAPPAAGGLGATIAHLTQGQGVMEPSSS